MTIWILALILFAALAGAGYRQGAIRVLFSLFGLIVSALTAIPLGRLLQPMMTHMGLKNPALAATVGPFTVFVLVLILFKTVGWVVHRKVGVYYKYSAGDLHTTLWTRLNRRLGLCLGLLNALIYLLLISMLVYTMSYWTIQMSSSEKEKNSFAVNTLNLMGTNLVSSGFVKAVRAIDPATENYYDSADIVGTIYRNPLIDARLSRYPGILSLAERQEFQDLAKDKDYIEMLQRQAPLSEMFQHPKTKQILENNQLLNDIWAVLKDDLKDLRTFLETGNSQKYDGEKILGRWVFDVNGALQFLKKTRPNMNSVELQRFRQFIAMGLGKAIFIAAPDHQAFLKGAVQFKPGAGPGNLPEPENLHGQWKKMENDKYQFSFTGKENQEMEATFQGEKLFLHAGMLGLVFERED